MSTIYVSSTFADLKEHRKTLSLAIRRLGHVDIAMEYYIAEEARPVDRCVRDAGSCDLYVGLFAHRYGYCPPGEGRSITELEFRAARAAGIDCLCFLVPEDVAWPGEMVESGAGAGKLKELRDEIGAHYLCGFFTSPQELAAIASAAIVRNFDLGHSPFDARREHRLMKAWRSADALPTERVRAAQALVNMGSPRYAAAIKEQLLYADQQGDAASIAHYLDELQQLASSRQELMPIFLDLLEHESEHRRYFAVFQLGELALRGATLAPVAVEALLARSTDESASIRAELAHTLGKLSRSARTQAGVLQTLEQLAEDGSPRVRALAAESLKLVRENR